MKNDKLKRNMKNTIMIYTSKVIESNIEIKVIIFSLNIQPKNEEPEKLDHL